MEHEQEKVENKSLWEAVVRGNAATAVSILDGLPRATWFLRERPAKMGIGI